MKRSTNPIVTPSEARGPHLKRLFAPSGTLGVIPVIR
jgi:hypothetical protein